jgi:TRAP-type C4-dicarboxylate transport system permease small subunit
MNGGNGVRALLMLTARWCIYASALFLVAMMLITVADVTARSLFNRPITGAYDLVQLFLVGTVFLSIPDVFLRGENIVIDFVDHFFSTHVVHWLRFAASLAAFVFLAVLAWRMVQPALDSVRFHEVSLDLSIPMWVYWGLMIGGIVLTLPMAIRVLVESVQNLLQGREA